MRTARCANRRTARGRRGRPAPRASQSSPSRRNSGRPGGRRLLAPDAAFQRRQAYGAWPPPSRPGAFRSSHTARRRRRRGPRSKISWLSLEGHLAPFSARPWLPGAAASLCQSATGAALRMLATGLTFDRGAGGREQLVECDDSILVLVEMQQHLLLPPDHTQLEHQRQAPQHAE